MSPQIIEKRKKLAEISDLALKLEKSSLADDVTVNFLIMKHIYNPKNLLSFASYKQWENKGFRVKKGERAFLLWGKPVRNKIETNENNEDSKMSKYKFFPLAYVFSDKQVEKL